MKVPENVDQNKTVWSRIYASDLLGELKHENAQNLYLTNFGRISYEFY